MATRLAFENNNEIGVFCALTNAYCLTGMLQQRRRVIALLKHN